MRAGAASGRPRLHTRPIDLERLESSLARVGRALVPGRAGLGVAGARLLVLCRDDQPPGGAPRAAGRRASALHAERRAGGTRARRHREGALRDRGRPAGRGRPHALSRRPALALPVEPVGLPAHLHLLRDRADEVRPQPDRVGDRRPGSPLQTNRACRPRRLHGHGRAAHEPRQRAGRVRAPARGRHRHEQHRDLDGRLDPRHRADDARGPAGDGWRCRCTRRRRRSGPS